MSDDITKDPQVIEEDILDSAEEETDATDFLGLSDESIAQICEALDTGDVVLAHNLLIDLTPSDKAELLEKVSREQRHALMRGFADDFEAIAISNLQEEVRRQVLEDMTADQVARIISELESDDALDLILPLDGEFQKEILRRLSAKTRIAIQEGLSYPEESAGRLMQREFVAVPQFWTVGKTLDYLHAARESLPEDFYDIIVIDPTYHVMGEIPVGRLVRAGRSEKIDALSLKETHTIPATMDQEEVATLFRNIGMTSAPVVDDDGRLIGIITHDDVIFVIDEEAEEDILKLGGLKDDDLYSPVITTTIARVKWLTINLFTAVLASYVVSFFDVTIEKIVALAILMPIVAGMGGNAGTQSMTVAVRALATGEISGANAWRVIGKETMVGALNGVVFAIMIAVAAGFWFHSLGLGLVIGTAMIVNLIVAGFFGASIPVLLDKVGIDPAVASSVFLTTMTDVIGFFAFLGLATIFLL